MSESKEHMSPDESPGGVTKTTGTRRVNKLPLVIILCVVGAFLTIMAVVAAQRAAKQNKPAAEKTEQKQAGNTDMYAKALTGDQTSGLIPPAKDQAKKPEVPGDPAKTGKTDEVKNDGGKRDQNGPPPPPSRLGQQSLPANDEETRIQKIKIQQLEDAIKAKSTVQTIAPRSAGSSPSGASAHQQNASGTQQNPNDTLKERMEMLKETGVLDALKPQGAEPKLAQNSSMGTSTFVGKNISQFENPGKSDRWKLDSKPDAPRSPYELRAGFVVPALLISGINSDLPGQIMGQVSQDVYDTATGKWKLIPQGSRLVGSYSSEVAYGQARVLVAWQRIVFPDGKAMDIGAMPGADAAGYAGFNDQVNNHYFRLFSSAVLMSAVTAGISMSQPQQTANTTQNANTAMSAALGQQLGQVTAQLIAKNMNIAPTLEIRPGYRFNVIVTKDLTFSKPYEEFDY